VCSTLRELLAFPFLQEETSFTIDVPKPFAVEVWKTTAIKMIAEEIETVVLLHQSLWLQEIPEVFELRIENIKKECPGKFLFELKSEVSTSVAISEIGREFRRA
jgi:hypothetical protein